MSSGIRFPDNIIKWSIFFAAGEEEKANQNYRELTGDSVTDAEKAQMEYVRHAVSRTDKTPPRITNLDELTQKVLDVTLSIGYLVRKTFKEPDFKVKRERFFSEYLQNLKEKTQNHRKLSQQVEIAEQAFALFKKVEAKSNKENGIKKTENFWPQDISKRKREIDSEMKKTLKEFSLENTKMALESTTITGPAFLNNTMYNKCAEDLKRFGFEVSNQYSLYIEKLDPNSKEPFDFKKYTKSLDAFFKNLEDLEQKIENSVDDSEARNSLFKVLDSISDIMDFFDKTTFVKMKKLKEQLETVDEENYFNLFLKRLDSDVVLSESSASDSEQEGDLFKMEPPPSFNSSPRTDNEPPSRASRLSSSSLGDRGYRFLAVSPPFDSNKALASVYTYISPRFLSKENSVQDPTQNTREFKKMPKGSSSDFTSRGYLQPSPIHFDKKRESDWLKRQYQLVINDIKNFHTGETSEPSSFSNSLLDPEDDLKFEGL